MRALHGSMIALACLLCVATGSGCAPSIQAVYAGPERPLSEVAVLHESLDVVVHAIDNERVFGSAFALEPGWHSIWIKVKIIVPGMVVGRTYMGYCHLPTDLVAGETYTAKLRKETNPDNPRGDSQLVEFVVENSARERVARAEGCSDKPSVIESKRVADQLVEGSWGWRSRGPSCEKNPHTFRRSDDGRGFVLEFVKPEPRPVVGDGRRIEYELLAENRVALRMQIVGEPRKTDAGDPFVWDLVQTSPGSYCWRRTDWPASACSSPIERCDD